MLVQACLQMSIANNKDTKNNTLLFGEVVVGRAIATTVSH